MGIGFVNNDPLYINAAFWDKGQENFWDASLGPPPIKFRKSLWINSFSTRQWFVSSSDYPGRPSFRLSQYAYAPLFILNIDEDWKTTFGSHVSVRNANSKFLISRNSLFYSGFLFFSKRFESRENFRISFGIVVPDRSSSIPVIPGVGLDYEDQEKSYQIRLGWPASWWMYRPREDIKAGMFFSYISGAFLLSEDSIFRADGLYLAESFFVLGPFLKYNLKDQLWVNASCGYTLARSTYVESASFKKTAVLEKENGWLGSLGISARFN